MTDQTIKNNYVNVINKTKSLGGGIKAAVWVGLREKEHAPDYDQFKRICQNEHVHLLTTEEDYTDGICDKGKQFCPTIKNYQDIHISHKTIKMLLVEWRQDISQH